jgi:hypothetical protein
MWTMTRQLVALSGLLLLSTAAASVVVQKAAVHAVIAAAEAQLKQVDYFVDNDLPQQENLWIVDTVPLVPADNPFASLLIDQDVVAAPGSPTDPTDTCDRYGDQVGVEAEDPADEAQVPVDPAEEAGKPIGGRLPATLPVIAVQDMGFLQVATYPLREMP